MGRFEELASAPLVLTEGAVIERLRRDARLTLDPWVDHAGFIYDPAGQSALGRIESQYLDIGHTSGLPLIVFSPTWHANPDRLAKAGLREKNVNADAVRFLKALVAMHGAYSAKVLIGGLVGCRGDAYRPEEALATADAQRFHRTQIQELAHSGVDFLCAATLPAASEAEGIALAMAATELPYVLSFVIGADGCLLDGTPLHETVAAIDARVSRAPSFYLINCVHPSVFRASMTREMMVGGREMTRVIGLQANTSPRAPHELDGLPVLDSEDPELLADAMVRLSLDFGTRILGGCCGTDDRHIRAIARKGAARLRARP